MTGNRHGKAQSQPNSLKKASIVSARFGSRKYVSVNSNKHPIKARSKAMGLPSRRHREKHPGTGVTTIARPPKMTKSNSLALFAWLVTSQALLFGWLLQPSGTSHRPEGFERLDNLLQENNLRDVFRTQPPCKGRLIFCRGGEALQCDSPTTSGSRPKHRQSCSSKCRQIPMVPERNPSRHQIQCLKLPHTGRH